jgi:hypothetical protein
LRLVFEGPGCNDIVFLRNVDVRTQGQWAGGAASGRLGRMKEVVLAVRECWGRSGVKLWGRKAKDEGWWSGRGPDDTKWVWLEVVRFEVSDCCVGWLIRGACKFESWCIGLGFRRQCSCSMSVLSAMLLIFTIRWVFKRFCCHCPAWVMHIGCVSFTFALGSRLRCLFWRRGCEWLSLSVFVWTCVSVGRRVLSL